MNDQVRMHIQKHCEAKGWGTDDATIIEVIREAERLHRREVGQRRWWNEYLYVVEVNGMIIGYIYAEASRDLSVAEMGYDFDPSTIRVMRLVEKVVTVYEDAV